MKNVAFLVACACAITTSLQGCVVVQAQHTQGPTADVNGQLPTNVHTSTYSVVRQNNVVIDGHRFSNAGPGPCLLIANSSNVTVRNSTLQNCTAQFAVQITSSSNVTIQSNRFKDDFSWVNVQSSTAVKVKSNTMSNQIMPAPHIYGGIQFNNVTGGGNEISGNTIVNTTASRSEDNISVYKSSGLPTDPIIVKSNCVTGRTTNASGSGINVGDGGGSYIVVLDNVVKDAGAGGIGVSGGHHIQILRNKIVQTGRPGVNGSLVLKDFTGVGCSNITMDSNLVDYTNAKGVKVDGWNGTIWKATNCTDVSRFETNTFNADLGGTTCSSIQGQTRETGN